MIAKSDSLGKRIREYLMITLALVVYTLGWTLFLIPNKIVGGGATGIGALLYHITGFPVGYTYLIFNVVAIALAMRLVGANFGVKTIYGVLLTAVLLRIEQLVFSSMQQPLMANDPFLASLIGGLMSGLGIGMTFGQGGSSGGTDIIAMIINKYRNISPGRAILAIDVIIISCSIFLPGGGDFSQRLETLMYGYIVMVATSYTIDAYLSGIKQSMQLMIFSKNYSRIADRITNELKRGATVVDGTGWYSKENTKITITMIRKHEIGELYRIVKEEDPDAFISVASVTGVYGKGFEVIRK